MFDKHRVSRIRLALERKQREQERVAQDADE